MSADRSKRLIIIFSRGQKETHQERKIKRKYFFFIIYSAMLSVMQTSYRREKVLNTGVVRP